MPITESKLQYTTMPQKAGKTAAIIVAAGSSSRMGGVDKQMLTIGGVPVVARTMLRFQATPEIDTIVVVTREEKIGAMQRLADEYGISKLAAVVQGGDTRQMSVKNGIDALGGSVECVLIHDGARPLIKEATISAVAMATAEFGAAACGVRVYDTVKKIDADGYIVGTVDRESLIRIQTPQGFRLADYKKAMEICPDINTCTDDCAVMESAGYKIKLVVGDDTNIKVTTPKDVEMAESILAAEELK